MKGFLGTRAGLGPDLALIITLALGSMSAVGWLLARRRWFPSHCRLMAVAALSNWVMVLIVMVPPWVGLARLGTGALASPRTFAPLLHGLTGGVSQLLMSYTVVRMYWVKRLPPRRTHWLMVTAMIFWLLSTVGGSGVYVWLYVL